jgi:hypothetical protein
MDKLVLDLDGITNIVVTSVGGDLRLSGWDNPQLHVEGDDETLSLEKVNDHITLRGASDCTIRVPRGLAVVVHKVGGDARIKSLEAQLTIDLVGGSLTLRQVGQTVIERIGGDLSAKKIEGHLRVGKAGGDLWARGVAGDVQADQVGGDLYVRDVQGAIGARAGGSVTLDVDFQPRLSYQVSAGSDILCRVAPGTDARFDIQASGDIEVDVPGASMEGQPGHRLVTLGNAADGAQVRLIAGGEAVLAGTSADPDSMGDFGDRFGEDFGVMAEELAAQIESQIESQIGHMERTLGERLAGLGAGMDSSKVERLAARARRVAERVEEKAQRKAEAARRRGEAAQRRADRLTERAQQRGFAFRFDGPSRPASPPRPPAPPAPLADPVTDEERMMILRMVEQGRISVGDAEKLLAALENR